MLQKGSSGLQDGASTLVGSRDGCGAPPHSGEREFSEGKMRFDFVALGLLQCFWLIAVS